MTPPLPRKFMRVTLGGTLPARATHIRMRPATPSDLGNLGALMYSAYLGTVDYEGESEADAVREVEKTFAGGYGQFDGASSKLIDQQDGLAAAVLITRAHGSPFVAFTMTHPRFKRSGLARACMVAAMHSLFAAEERELRLLVTLANIPAVQLYRSLGFEFEI